MSKSIRKKIFSIRIDKENLDMLDEIAEKTTFTRNSLINFILHAVKNSDYNKIEAIKKLNVK